jgi:hypothetical protein
MTEHKYEERSGEEGKGREWNGRLLKTDRRCTYINILGTEYSL